MEDTRGLDLPGSAIQKGHIMSGKVLTAVVVLITGSALAAPAPQSAATGPQAKEVLAKIAVPKGVCVVLGLPEA